jgi:CHAT domain-containing protein
MNNDFLQSQEYEMLKGSIDTAVKNHHSEKEQELTTILKTLVDSGYITQAQIEDLTRELSQELYNALMREMLSAYTDEDIENLIQAHQTGLNEVQMTELYLRLYEQRKNKELELYAIEVIEGFVEQLIIQLKIAKQTVDDVKNLSDDQATIIIDLIEQGLVDEAEKRLEEFKNGKSETTQTSKPSVESSDISKDDLQMLYQMLKNNYVEESKNILEKLLSNDSKE